MTLDTATGPHRVLAVIPARAGSVRVPNKNLFALGQSTLVGEAIAHATTYPVDRIVVSTDCDALFEDLSAYCRADHDPNPPVGAWTSLIPRPPHLATGYRDSLRDVIRHALIEAERMDGYTYDLVVTLQPAVPLRTSGLITAILDQFLDPADPAYPVAAITGVPIVPWTWSAHDGLATNAWSPGPYPLSQDCPGQRWQEINTVQVATRDVVLAGERWRTPLLVALLPTWAALDIDTPEDLREAQRVYPLLELALRDHRPDFITVTAINPGSRLAIP